MPRGSNPNSRKNLKKFGSEDRDPKEYGKRGGEASVESRRIRKTFRELDLEETTDDEIRSMLNMVKKLGARGNLNAIKLYVDIVGMETKESSSEIDDNLKKAKELLGGIQSVID